MSTEPISTCPTCGALIPEAAPGGLCPVCVLKGSQSDPADPAAGAAPPPEEIAAAFGELEILGLIGRGGMGAVYHARQPKLDREIALKILLPDLGADPAFAERFTREARALAKLNHPNIVTVFDFGERDGLFYLMMEFVDGVNLRGAMAAGRFTPEQALAVIPGICDALQAAHDLGILHRDIKPENILLDRDGKVKIVDFGIARIVGDSASDFTLTEAGAVLGSRQYMAPEQIEGSHQVDHRADIYSLGVVFYEMLTGELPIGRFLLPSEKVATSQDIDQIVLRALEKELDRRFQSAGEVKTEVEGASPRPVGTPRQRGSAPESPPPPGRNAIAGIARLTLAALGMLVAGLALLACAAVLEENDSVSIPIGIAGATVCLFGYVSCWLGLRAMRRGEISAAGRFVLQLIAAGVPVAAAITGVAYACAYTLSKQGEGAFYLTIMSCTVAGFLAAAFLCRLAEISIRHRWTRGVLIAVMLLGLGGAIYHAQRNDGIWPHVHAFSSGTFGKNWSRGEPPEMTLEEEVRKHGSDLDAAIRLAAGRHFGDYFIERRRQGVDVAVLHAETHPGGKPARAHLKAFAGRLKDALPAQALDTVYMREGAWGWMRSELLRNWTGMFLYIGLISATSAAGLALVGGSLGRASMAGALLVSGALIVLPPRPYPSDWPKLIDSPPPPPLERHEIHTPATVDFSTPIGAVAAVVDAAERGDIAAMRRGVTDDSWSELTEVKRLDEESILAWFDGSRLCKAYLPARLNPSAEQDADSATVNASLLPRDPDAKLESRYIYCRRMNGEWRVVIK